jgi:xanthine dehydrogenase YagS FAD-binding subunit
MLPVFAFVRPTSIPQALAELDTPGARLHAGGTDLLGLLRGGVEAPAKLVDVSGIGELRGITPTSDGGLRIGATTTLAELAASGLVAERAPALGEAASSAASPQLRNQGTLGGNLCQRPRCWYFRGDFPCLRKGGERCFAYDGENEYHAIFGGERCFAVHPSDTAPALVALGAQAHVVGRRRDDLLPVEALYVRPGDDPTRETVLGPGDILTEVRLPPRPGWRSVFRKARARRVWDFALASVAVAIRESGDEIGGARIALGGVALVPWRATDAERALAGAKLTTRTAAAAATACLRGAAPLAGNGYKLALVRGLVEDALLGLAGAA